VTSIIILFGKNEITGHKLKQVKSTGVLDYIRRWNIPLLWKDGSPVTADDFKARSKKAA
jgi:hypothetical protein